VRIFPCGQRYDLMHRYVFRGHSQSIRVFGFFIERFQEFAKYIGGRPKRLGEDESRRRVVARAASDSGEVGKSLAGEASAPSEPVAGR
jgi:hypothetical protein